MSTGSDFLRLLYKDFGRPLVKRVMDAIGDQADEATIRKAVQREAKKAATKPAKTTSVATTFDKVTDYDKAMDIARKGKHLKRDSGLLAPPRSRNAVTDKHTSRPAKKGGKSGGGLSAPAPGHAGAGGRSAS